MIDALIVIYNSATSTKLASKCETNEIVGCHPRVRLCLTNSDAAGTEKDPKIAAHDAVGDIVVVKS